MHKISLSQFVSCKQRNEWQENVQKFYRYRNCGQRCVWSQVECKQITEAMGYVTTECRPQTHGCPPLTAGLLFVVTIIIIPHVNPVQNECYITDERQQQSNSVKVGSMIFLFCLKMILKSTLVLQVVVILQIFLEMIQVLIFHREPDSISNHPGFVSKIRVSKPLKCLYFVVYTYFINALNLFLATGSQNK